ncbi:putative membrane protein YdfJ with MMPL/SSD domain [Shinella sp. BE166]|uniref:hypothetical protein n=1 Tax=Shinella sp. BE166 TaxID=3373918 RepID=UPI003EBF40A9
MDDMSGAFASTTERTAWNIAARHLARGQTDPVVMIVDEIAEERKRWIELLYAAVGRDAELPAFIVNPDLQC